MNQNPFSSSTTLTYLLIPSCISIALLDYQILSPHFFDEEKGDYVLQFSVRWSAIPFNSYIFDARHQTYIYTA